MEFNYYYGEEAEQFSFIRIPKVMLTEERFSILSLNAKILYGLLLDRMSLSAKNGWFDSEKRVFIIFKIEAIQEILGFSKKKSMEVLNELEQFGLVEKKRRGQGQPSILYIKSFILPDMENNKNSTSRGVENDTSVNDKEKRDLENNDGKNCQKDVLKVRNVEITTEKKPENKEIVRQIQEEGNKSCVRGVDLGTSRDLEIAFQEVQFLTPQNNTKDNNININNKSNLILSASNRMGLDEMNDYRELLMDNINYPGLLKDYPYDEKLIEGILELMLEVVVSQKEYLIISSDRYPTELVRSKFLKIRQFHIGYVIDCFLSNNTKVKNIKKYLMAAIFNAPSTMSGYYQAKSKSEMSEYVN